MSMALQVDRLKLTEYSAEIMVYFERHKLLEIIPRIMAEVAMTRPADPGTWMGQNVKRIANEIYQKFLRGSQPGSPPVEIYQLPRRFRYRAVIYGRSGSGRKSQAVAIAKHFKVIYIDADVVIYQNLRETGSLAKNLQEAFHGNDVTAKSDAVAKVISHRLLMDDCLRQGWVLVNFPNSLYQVKLLFEQFKIPPNKFIYLDCPETMAQRRLLSKPDMGSPQNNCDYISMEMYEFSRTEPEIREYLEQRHEVSFVCAVPCFEPVKIDVWAKLMHFPYLMGFKQT